MVAVRCFPGTEENEMKQIGIALVTLGAGLVLIGLLFVLGGNVPFVGRLPGDIHYRGERTSFSFPVTTCILVSIVLTIAVNVVLRLFRK